MCAKTIAWTKEMVDNRFNARYCDKCKRSYPFFIPEPDDYPDQVLKTCPVCGNGMGMATVGAAEENWDSIVLTLKEGLTPSEKAVMIDGLYVCVAQMESTIQRYSYGRKVLCTDVRGALDKMKAAFDFDENDWSRVEGKLKRVEEASE